MKFHGIQITEGTDITNLTVASGTGSFPSSPNEGELFFRTDSALTIKGLYAYIGGSWDRIASSDSLTSPSGADFPGVANVGDLFYKNSNDAFEALYVYNGSTWVIASGSSPSYTITGDVTGTIDGGTDVLTLGNTAVTPGSYGAAGETLTATVDAKGRLTALNDTPIDITTAQVSSGTFADARIAQSNVTQHQAALTLAASQTTSGTFADARIAQSNVTQHQAALSINESQIPDGSLLARNAGNETISGNWSFNNPVTAADPSGASHLTTKQYVDNALLGLTWKRPARVATTANITLSGLQTIDGVSVIAGDRVLVKNQTTTADNGLWVASASSWTRATDFDAVSPVDEINSAAVFVSQGTTQADTGWTQTALVATVGTDPMTFVQFSAAGAYTAGAGLSLSGNTFNVGTASASRIVVNVDDIDLATVGTPVTDVLRKITTDSYGRVSATSAVVAGDLTGILDATYVNTTGDTMSGALAISMTDPTLVLTDTTASTRQILFRTNNLNRMSIGANSTAESGSNAGSNFYINRYDDTGASLGTALLIERSSGNIGINTTPVSGAGKTLHLQQTTNTGTVSDNGTIRIESTNRNANLQLMPNSATGSGGLQWLDGGQSGVAQINYQTSEGHLKFMVNTSATERARITSAGNLYVGTTGGSGVDAALAATRRYLVLSSPDAGSIGALTFVGQTGNQGNNGNIEWYDVGNTSSSSLRNAFIFSGSSGSTANNRGSFMAFATKPDGVAGGGSEAMRITQDGYIGIGTSVPAYGIDFQHTHGSPMFMCRYGDFASSTSLSMAHSRGTSVGSNVIVQNGDILGSLLFVGANGTGFSTSSIIRGEVDGVPGATNDMPGRLIFMTAPDNSATPSERMRINALGNVGIGSLAPLTRLHVQTGDTNPIMATRASDVTVNGASGVTIDIGALNGTSPVTAAQVGAVLNNPSTTGYFYIATRNADTLSERMRINADGNTGIGINASVARLEVNATGTAGSSTTVGIFSQTASGTTGTETRLHIGGGGGVSRGVYLAGVNSTGAGNGHDMVLATNGSTAAPVERMRIDNLGNVGVNTNSPSTYGLFSVVNNTTRFVALTPTSSINVARFRYDDNAGALVQLSNFAMQAANHGIGLNFSLGHDGTGNDAGRITVLAEQTWTGTASTRDAYMQFATAADNNLTERMRITGAGDLLVGTSSTTIGNDTTTWFGAAPNGGALANQTVFHAPNNASTGWILAGFYRGSSQIGSIQYNGTGTSFVTTSDVRLKQNIVDAGPAGAILDAIQIRQFEYVDSGTSVEHGVIAQELHTVMPSAVNPGSEAGNEHSSPWGVDYSKLVPLLVKEIQELRARVAALEAQ